MMAFSTRRAWLLTAAVLGLALGGCGGGSSSSGDVQLRVLNVSSDVASVDLSLDDTTKVQAVAIDSLSSYVGIGADTYDVDVLATGNSSSLNNSSRSFSKDKHYTAVVWGRQSAIKLSTLPEDDDEADISTGKAKLRVFSATADLGNVDVYLTRDDTALDSTTPVASSVASAGLSSYATLDSGSWRLRVTGAGDSSDVRLDVAAVALSDKKYNTLVLTAGSGGVLVHATVLVQQQSGVATAKNTQARLRVVAGVESKGSVGVAWNGITQASGLRSPAVAPYALVAAGTHALELRINGIVASTGDAVLSPGADYTLLAYGDAAAPKLSLISDDNRLPSSTSRVKLRLIHGAATADALTLSIDYAALISDLPLGSASAFTTLTANSSARVDISSVSAAETLYTATEVNLQALGVYTAFLLGGNSTPTGVLRKDR